MAAVRLKDQVLILQLPEPVLALQELENQFGARQGHCCHCQRVVLVVP